MSALGAAVGAAFLVGNNLLLGVLFLLIAATTATGVVVVPVMWLRVRSRRDLVEEPVDVLADASGIQFRSVHGEGKLAWRMFKHAFEDNERFFLDTGAGFKYVIPKRAFTGPDVDSFRGLLGAVGVLKV